MKKKYISPTVEVLNLQVENIIALSLPQSEGESFGGSDALSHRTSGGSSEDWSDGASDEE